MASLWRKLTIYIYIYIILYVKVYTHIYIYIIIGECWQSELSGWAWLSPYSLKAPHKSLQISGPQTSILRSQDLERLMWSLKLIGTKPGSSWEFRLSALTICGPPTLAGQSLRRSSRDTIYNLCRLASTIFSFGGFKYIRMPVTMHVVGWPRLEHHPLDAILWDWM